MKEEAEQARVAEEARLEEEAEQGGRSVRANDCTVEEEVVEGLLPSMIAVCPEDADEEDGRGGLSIVRSRKCARVGVAGRDAVLSAEDLRARLARRGVCVMRGRAVGGLLRGIGKARGTGHTEWMNVKLSREGAAVGEMASWSEGRVRNDGSNGASSRVSSSAHTAAGMERQCEVGGGNAVDGGTRKLWNAVEEIENAEKIARVKLCRIEQGELASVRQTHVQLMFLHHEEEQGGKEFWEIEGVKKSGEMDVNTGGKGKREGWMLNAVSTSPLSAKSTLLSSPASRLSRKGSIASPLVPANSFEMGETEKKKKGMKAGASSLSSFFITSSMERTVNSSLSFSMKQKSDGRSAVSAPFTAVPIRPGAPSFSSGTVVSNLRNIASKNRNNGDDEWEMDDW